MHVRLPEWDPDEWADVVIRARADSASSVNVMGLGFNLREPSLTAAPVLPACQLPGGRNTPVVRDGTVHTYQLRLPPGLEGTIRELCIYLGSEGEPGSIDILSVSVVPKGAEFADDPHGVRPVTIGDRIRRALYAHAPGRLAYRVRVPEGGRLDAGLGVLGADVPVTFRVTVESGGREEVLLEERYGDAGRWTQRSVDLSRYAGREVTLALETDATQPGTVSFWGAPTLSGPRTSDKPNVIFYVIDGGAADQMSVYGYNRRTTPNLERLAAEGAVFEHAYSNAPWTKPSTTGFMTSLQSSVLGNVAGGMFEPLPAEARTMAERFHAAGYETAVFTSNPWAGSLSNLEHGADAFRDQGVPTNAGSSVALHRDFWDWRDGFPGEPYWVHFQTTDVHDPSRPIAPFAGLFASPREKLQLEEWISTLSQWRQRNAVRIRTEPGVEHNQWAETGIDRNHFYGVIRSIHDETVAGQDYQLGRFVDRLKEVGQWDNTLLIVAADHSLNAGATDFLVPLEDPVPPEWLWDGGSNQRGPIFRSSVSRVPLIFVWPGRIAGGQRFSHPVSMIDVLPTVLDLAGLPMPAVLQGQSLAPLLLGRSGWRPRPVIFDEFVQDPRTGALRGRIEMIDGRWGASLWIGPPADPQNHRPTPLLLFDVWNDPLALRPMNDEHPELMTKYTALLEQQWEAHRLLAQRFTAGGEVELTPEQLETLRSLGYIR